MLGKATQDNIFCGALPAAFELLPSLWFRGARVDADVPHSTQALAPDVFGAVSRPSERKVTGMTSLTQRSVSARYRR
jgi:hypothetical protein